MRLRFDSRVVPSSLVPIGRRSIAYSDGDNVWSLSISSCEITQLTHFTNAIIKQVDYSPRNKLFLLNLSFGKGDPHLYRFDSRTNAAGGGFAEFTDRYNFERISGGNWIAEGNTGLAFSTKNFLGVSTKDGAFHTNLFSEGYYRSFSVSPQRDKIFALASVANEPLGIWSYDVNYGSLDVVVPPKEQFEFSQWVTPSEVEIVRTNSRRIVYPMMARSDLPSKSKSPVLLNLIGSDPHEAWLQILANAGVVSVSIRPKSLNNLKTIFNDLSRQSKIDPEQLYIMGQGADAAMISTLLTNNSFSVRGVILIHPSELPSISTTQSTPPQFLVFPGSNKDVVYALKMERFLQMACYKLISAQLVFDEDIARISPKADLNQARYDMATRFILTGNLK